LNANRDRTDSKGKQKALAGKKRETKTSQRARESIAFPLETNSLAKLAAQQRERSSIASPSRQQESVTPPLSEEFERESPETYWRKRTVL
jgi:hypothetical protein